MNIRKRTKRLAAAAAVTAVAGLGVVGMSSPAGAAPTNTIVYSSDGGNTWVTDATVPAGANVLVRVYYDNDTANDITDAQVSTSIPAGFTRVPDTTRVCLNPGTTDPTRPSAELKCNTDTGMGGPIDESAVWSGDTLTIAPNAGVYGVPTDATSGLLAAGSPRYLNLNQCQYARQDGGDIAWYSSHLDSSPGGNFSAGTNVANTADSLPSCDSGNSVWPHSAVWSGVEALDLLGNRYLNLHQCEYQRPDNTGDAWFMNMINRGGRYSAGTNVSNAADPAPSCGSSTAPWSPSPAYTSVSAFDLIGNRYLNLHQCQYVRADGEDVSWFVTALDRPSGATAYAAGTNVSDAPDAAPDCGPAQDVWSFSPGWSGVTPLDLLDTTRGQGFVEFEIVAPSPDVTTTYPQDSGMTGTGTGSPADTGTITVEAFEIPAVGSWPLATGMAVVGGGGLALIRRRRGGPVRIA
jgi:hypothetical protein